MPYQPHAQFDPSLIFRGITGAGESLGAGIADFRKRREQAEAQLAGSFAPFTTLRNANLLSDQEISEFNKGNANQRHALITAATPRLLQNFQTERERNDNSYKSGLVSHYSRGFKY
jgi:hypothetical protein